MATFLHKMQGFLIQKVASSLHKKQPLCTKGGYFFAQKAADSLYKKIHFLQSGTRVWGIEYLSRDPILLYSSFYVYFVFSVRGMPSCLVQAMSSPISSAGCSRGSLSFPL